LPWFTPFRAIYLRYTLHNHSQILPFQHSVNPRPNQTKSQPISKYKRYITYMRQLRKQLLFFPVFLSPVIAQNNADFDKSGRVDFLDFIAFAQAFGSTQAPFDLNGNGRVDFPDFLTFTQAFAQDIQAPDTVVTFADLNLETAIRDALQKPTGDLLRQDVITLKHLTVFDRNIITLTGINQLENLEELEMPVNQISDLSPLKSLIKLRRLQLSENSITDISPLQNLTNLENLRLERNQISDITPLQNLPKLTGLFLLLNKVTNITPLQNLTTLEDLELDENGIQNIDVLRHLTRLHTLDIIGNQITDLQALTDNEGMNFGDDIYIANNPLSATAINQQIPILEARGVTVHLE